MRLILIILMLPLLSFAQGDGYSALDISPEEMILKVNELRRNGCYCGRKYMRPVGPIKWNSTLYKSAYSHARDMSRRRYFSHVSRRGWGIGDRASRFGYHWEVIGENLGDGQTSFNEVFRDWIKSPEHCKMLMHPKVIHMAVARYRDKWVQHFGKPMP